MRKGKEKGEMEEKKPSATDWVNYAEAWKLKNPCIDGATHKKRAMDVTPFSGVLIQNVGAIYTRTLEVGGAIYSQCGVDR